HESAEKKALAEKDADSEEKTEARGGGIGERAKAAAAADAGTDSAPLNSTQSAATKAESPESHSSRLPRVTAIRHWSTPDYTRVAIDLESEVKFGSQRIAHPDRIFFDLRDTKLASTLVGKSFDVDDGFLKKIRVAQFQPGRTRVVLEVDNLSTYEAFLLPNPYRLIIDIHGKGDKVAHSKLSKEEVAALADVEAPPSVEAKAHVPRPEVKADMKALAGKPATKQEAIHNDQHSSASSDATTADQDAATETSNPSQSKRAEVEAKSTPPVKKVIVDNDDDDDVPAPAKSTSRRSVKKASHPAEGGANGADVPQDPVSAEADESAPVHTSSKASSRLSARRKGDDLEVRVAKPTASGDRSLIRTLGLKIGKIVIDPGHGGHDTGTIGPDGLEEKDLV